jgi:hypothetical protein
LGGLAVELASSVFLKLSHTPSHTDEQSWPSHKGKEGIGTLSSYYSKRNFSLILPTRAGGAKMNYLTQ